ncbi:hypothetical protein [Nocardiopsis salina]|uniref:hypothetical protein n=1 Tax=Nocardiopsis salina TaxID=245836 RepID=UPI000345EEB3|nr:hypothetical protein [Nocardiopsis salina]
MPKCIAAVFKAALELLRELLQALFSQPKGRHSAGEARRRRAKRVRRYAPMIPATPAPLPSHPAVRRSQGEPGEHPRSEPPTALRASTAPATPAALRPPSVEFEADEVALVRPYYRAHETGAAAGAEADRIQDRATARLRAWGADLDHLEFGPDSAFSLGFDPGPAPDGTRARAYTLDEYRDPDPEPEPPAPAASSAGRTAARGHGCGAVGGVDGSSGPTTDPTDTFRVPGPRMSGPRVPARMSGLPHLSRIRARQQQRRSRTLAEVGA